MNTSRTYRLKTTGLAVESLEDRRLMANFGTPWPDARSLAVSFPTDQAAVGAYRNGAREVLDQVTDRLQWQEAALRAFQTWAVQANINVGLVPDRGDDFGAVGLSTNDPRFGEFRIGAFPQVRTLANALPYQQIAGTWSGDVLLNTHTNFFLADLNSTSPIQVPSPNEKGPAVEMFSVLLHEAGNALGLADNSIAGAVMNGTYSGPNTRLKSSDITAIRSLYGTRRDIYETISNNSPGRATPILSPAGFNGSTPLSVNGSLNTMSDVDFYRIIPLPGKDKVSIRLWASGISLVKANLEVLDRFGNKLADVKADSIFENNLQLDIGSLQDHPSLVIRVARNTSDVFAIGDYRLDIDYRDSSLQPALKPPAHDADAEDEDDSVVDYVSVDELFDQFGLVDTEVNLNDTLVTATPLTTTTGFLEGSRYELTSALASTADRDLWSFQAPSVASPTLSISVDPVTSRIAPLDVILLNGTGDRIASKLTRKADGGLSLVVANPVAGERYVLLVRSPSGTTVAPGNYVATINFATDPASQLRTVYSGDVTSVAPNLSKLTTYKTQLFRFDLSSQSVSNDTGVQLSIQDARTGAIVASMASANGIARTEYIWLGAGEYILRAIRRVRAANTATASFTLRADAISDDQGPLPLDPTQPRPTPLPDWAWEPLPPTDPPPIVPTVFPLPENPWSIDILLAAIDDYYRRFLA
jgi:Matrixin